MNEQEQIRDLAKHFSTLVATDVAHGIRDKRLK